MNCDKCGKEAICLPFPFRYRLNDAWFHPFGCRECLAWQKRLANYQRWKWHGIRTDLPLQFTVITSPESLIKPKVPKGVFLEGYSDDRDRMVQ